jgi:hypothetical protein
MPATKKPQDRLPKAEKPTAFTFEQDGQTFEIPPPSAALESIPGRAFRDMMLSTDDTGEVKFALRLIESVGADPAALDALYEKPTPQMLAVVGDWMRSDQALSGATLPES